MSDKTDPGTTSQEAAQAGTSTGTEDYSEIGSLNSNTVSKSIQKDPLAEETLRQTQSVMEKQPEVIGKETDGVSQSSPKDERHAAKKINELTESRMSFARKLVERDANAIYDIAEEDPKLAEKIFAEYEYDADSLEELLAMRENPKASKEEIQQSKRMSNIEEELFNEKVKRLKQSHEDLDDDLVSEFKKVYSNAAFKDKSEEQMLNIARASSGRETPTKKVDNSALEILKAQEGFQSTPKQSGEIKKRSFIPTDRAGVYKDSGVSEADMEKYLPSDIDDQIVYAYGHHGESS